MKMSEPFRTLDCSETIDSENLESIDLTIIPDEEGHSIPAENAVGDYPLTIAKLHSTAKSGRSLIVFDAA